MTDREPLIRFEGEIGDAFIKLCEEDMGVKFMLQQLDMEKEQGVMSFFFYWTFGMTATKLFAQGRRNSRPLIRKMKAYREKLEVNKGKRWKGAGQK